MKVAVGFHDDDVFRRVKDQFTLPLIGIAGSFPYYLVSHSSTATVRSLGGKQCVVLRGK